MVKNGKRRLWKDVPVRAGKFKTAKAWIALLDFNDGSDQFTPPHPAPGHMLPIPGQNEPLNSSKLSL